MSSSSMMTNLADPAWIENMVATAERYNASLVGGPNIRFLKAGFGKMGKASVFLPHYSKTRPVQSSIHPATC